MGAVELKMYMWNKTSRSYLAIAIKRVNSRVFCTRMDMEVHSYLSQLPTKDRLCEPCLGSVSCERSSFRCLFLDKHKFTAMWQNPSGACSFVWRSNRLKTLKSQTNKATSPLPKTKPLKTQPANKPAWIYPILCWLSTYNSLAVSARVLSCCAITNRSERTGLDVRSIKSCLPERDREFMVL